MPLEHFWEGDKCMQQTQMQTQNQTPTFMEPPQVITTKDCLYLKDMLSWELLAMKKCYHTAQECIDPQMKQAIDQAGQMHQRHYQILLKHLQHDNQTAMANVQQQMNMQQ